MNCQSKGLSLFLKGAMLFLVGIEALQTSGCSHFQPSIKDLPQGLPKSEDLLRTVKKRDEAIRSMRGVMSLLVRSGQRKYRLEEAFQIQKPAKIRVETLGLFGQPVFFLSSDGSTLSLFLPSEKRLYIGSSSSNNISHALPIFLELNEIVGLLTGNIPLIDSRGARASFDQKEGLMTMDLTPQQDEFPKQKLWIDIQKDLVVRGELRNGEGNLTWRVIFDRFQEIQGILTPTLIRIEMAKGPTTASIELDELEMNPTLKEDSFRLFVPVDTEIWSLQ